MSLDYLEIVLLSSLSNASILIISTIGLAIIFGLMGVINLAHGEFIMFGAYAALVITKSGIPFPVAVLLATLLTALFGAIVEKLIISKLYGRILDTMLATWGLSIVMYESAILIFGTVTPGIGLPQSTISIGTYTISTYLVMMIPMAIILMFGAYYLLTKTKYGVMSRASIADSATSAALGIETKRLNTITFTLGSAFAGFAGAVLLPIVSATPDMGLAFVVKSFLIVVVAGPLALSGTAATALSLGMVSNTVSGFYSSIIGDIVFFTITVMLLRFYPLGISNKWKFKL